VQRAKSSKTLHPEARFYCGAVSRPTPSSKRGRHLRSSKSDLAGAPRWTGPLTNTTHQLENAENSKIKRGIPSQTVRVQRDLWSKTGSNRRTAHKPQKPKNVWAMRNYGHELASTIPRLEFRKAEACLPERHNKYELSTGESYRTGILQDVNHSGDFGIASDHLTGVEICGTDNQTDRGLRESQARMA
jgi:hypothetical protein